MPFYEYDCPGCGRAFEKRVKMSEADQVNCPNCGNDHTNRRLSRINVKGSTSSGGTPTFTSGSL